MTPIDPEDRSAVADAFGVDQLRYFLLAEVTFGNDGSYSPEAIVQKANSDLANSFGNLAQRTLSMIAKNLDGVIPDAGDAVEDHEILGMVKAAVRDDIPQALERLAPSIAIDAWIKAVFACNQYVDAMAPWALRKTDPDRMAQVLGTLYACIRDLAIAVMPIIPTSAEALLNAMKVPDNLWTYDFLDSGTDPLDGRTIEPPKPLFPRLELPTEEGADPA